MSGMGGAEACLLQLFSAVLVMDTRRIAGGAQNSVGELSARRHGSGNGNIFHSKYAASSRDTIYHTMITTGFHNFQLEA